MEIVLTTMWDTAKQDRPLETEIPGKGCNRRIIVMMIRSEDILSSYMYYMNSMPASL